jgi:DNA-binding transcriptional LysR family regulator
MARLSDLPFDLHALEVFLAVCDAGSMAAAARQLRISQPAVSQIIGEIEARTGVTLFDRRVRPLGLTGAGSVLRQDAAALVTQARQITPRLREMQAGRLHLVRIGIVDSLSRALMGLLSDFMATRADQTVVLSGLTASHAAALLTRQLDLVVGVDDLEDVEGLERWPLVEEPYILVCPAREPAPRTVAELAAMAGRVRFARFSGRSLTGIEVERHLRRLRLDIPPGQEFDSPYGVIAACQQGAMAIATPFCLLEARIDLDGMRFHPLPGPALRRRLTLVGRHRELGRLPSDLAAAMHAALESGSLPRLDALSLGLANGVVIGPRRA